MSKPCEVIKKILSVKKSARIKLLGDSITHGMGGTGFEQNGEVFIEGFARNPNGYCWANNFKKYMHEKFGAEVINNGCTGTNIEFFINNFDKLIDNDDDLIICTIGTNNRHVHFYEGYKPTREELGTRFYNNVIKLNGMFKDAGKDVIFIANIPADECDGYDWWRILHMDDINIIYKKASQKFGFPLISLYDLITEYCETNKIEIDSLLADGLHPNDLGFDVMLNLLLIELGLK